MLDNTDRRRVYTFKGAMFMFILHALLEKSWEEAYESDYYGARYIESEGFIHCSDIHTFHKVAPNFAGINKPMVLLCIDVDRVEPVVKWEDLDNCGTEYPHIYGLLNLSAVTKIFPYLKDAKGNWIPNHELDEYRTK